MCIAVGCTSVSLYPEGNIENLSQTLLQPVFGALLSVTLPDTQAPEVLQAALEEACGKLQQIIDVNPAFPEVVCGNKPEIQPYIVVALGPDRLALEISIRHRKIFASVCRIQN